MNLFELFVKIGVDDQASGKLSTLTSKLGDGLKTAAKVGTAAVTAAAAGITALTTAAVNNYAEYEQLVGGVETLFKGSADTVQQYAENAYKTAGLSANEYMSTVTSFSASLLQSLGGDTEKAAEKADMAIRDMSDNANKFGSDIETLKTAYAGFAKGQFMLLDNLKLGYGGTQAEMKRLLEDAEKISGIKYDISSFADITQAIHIMQEEMGIAGATALEAGTTIEGSVNSMKAAWQNLITGLADGNANIGQLVDNLITTIAGDGTESNLGVIGNVLPAIETALGGAVKLIEGIFPKIIEALPNLINTLLPSIVSGAINIVQSFVTAISDNGNLLVQSAIDVVMILANGILNMLPEIIKLGLDLIVSLANGIAESIPELIPTIIDVIMQIVDTLTNPETLSNLLDASLAVILALADGLVQHIPALIDATVALIDNLITFLLDPENIIKLAEAAIEIVIALAEGLVKGTETLISSVGELISKVVAKFKETDWAKIGKDIVNGVLDGLKGTWNKLSSWFTDGWNGLVGGAKDLLGIHSPSRVFAGIGKNMALGVGEGWDDAFGNIQKGINNSMQFDEAKMGISVSKSYTGNNGMYPTNGANFNIYLDGNTLVGGISDRMNSNLGENYTLDTRGVMA